MTDEETRRRADYQLQLVTDTWAELHRYMTRAIVTDGEGFIISSNNTNHAIATAQHLVRALEDIKKFAEQHGENISRK